MPSPALHLLCVFILVSCLASPNYALTIQTSECEINGDPDVDGLGIRIGYYLQWLSLLLAALFSRSSMDIVRTNTNLITIAVLINTFRGARESDDLVVLE